MSLFVALIFGLAVFSMEWKILQKKKCANKVAPVGCARLADMMSDHKYGSPLETEFLVLKFCPKSVHDVLRCLESDLSQTTITACKASEYFQCVRCLESDLFQIFKTLYPSFFSLFCFLSFVVF